jgi:(1->4)-alpha-D-glucan 1-alpha-D-glucosylmutase
VPDRNDEILFYQTLIGAWPMSSAEMPGLKQRLQAYLIKAMREAAVHTRWTQPNLALEGALTEFVESVLSVSDDDPFLRDFCEFQRKVSYWGMLNGLAQVLLKIVCPGIPDFYQGSELWDLHLVDPDNRGRVDFGLRTALLRSIQEQVTSTPDPCFLQSLLDDWRDGRIKLYVIWQALNFRRKHPQLFLEGDYAPAEATGQRKRNVVAVARSYRGEHLVTAVPRWLAAAKAPANPRQMHRFWAKSELVLPPRSPVRWFNAFTGERLNCHTSRRPPALALGEIFRSFPVALLVAETE